MDLAPNLRVVLLQGSDANHAWRRLTRLYPAFEIMSRLEVVRSFHPSPQALFVRDPVQRELRRARRAEAFQEVADLLST